uniref:Uncharacterized protein n=1 Tax=Timema cristinae TaxID=61476 RepID=A0A7R9H5V2_TIMCR|nr:unnamed protein product [Timema cristinae]
MPQIFPEFVITKHHVQSFQFILRSSQTDAAEVQLILNEGFVAYLSDVARIGAVKYNISSDGRIIISSDIRFRKIEVRYNYHVSEVNNSTALEGRSFVYSTSGDGLSDTLKGKINSIVSSDFKTSQEIVIVRELIPFMDEVLNSTVDIKQLFTIISQILTIRGRIVWLASPPWHHQQHRIGFEQRHVDEEYRATILNFPYVVMGTPLVSLQPREREKEKERVEKLLEKTTLSSFDQHRGPIFLLSQSNQLLNVQNTFTVDVSNYALDILHQIQSNAQAASSGSLTLDDTQFNINVLSTSYKLNVTSRYVGNTTALQQSGEATVSINQTSEHPMTIIINFQYPSLTTSHRSSSCDNSSPRSLGADLRYEPSKFHRQVSKK